MNIKKIFRGFTLVEVVVVCAIVAIIATISLVTMKNLQSASAKSAASNGVLEALTAQREKTLSLRNDTVYGVHVSSTTITQFEGTTYTAGHASNTVYIFERGVTATSSLIAGSGNIIFERLTGKPSGTGRIYVRNTTGTTTVVIYATGLVEFE